MAVIYKVIERKNGLPGAKSERIAAAVTKQLGRVSLRELADDIADRCTLHRADVVAVLDALSTSTISFLKKGLGVSLGELGSFGLRLRGKSAPSKEEFDSNLIEKVLVRYRPSTLMSMDLNRCGLKNLDTLLAERKKAAEEGSAGSGSTGGEDTGGTGGGTGEGTGGTPSL